MRADRVLIPLILAVILLGVGSYLTVLHTQSEGEVEWIIWFSDTSPPLGKPVMVKVWAYDSQRLQTYDVSCNITIVNDEDVVLMDTFSGNPATYNFSFWNEDSYDVKLYCQANVNGNVTETSYSSTIDYRYPIITLSPENPKWGRPFTLTFTAEYSYNETATVTIGDDTYRVDMVNGVIQIPNVVIYDLTRVQLIFLNKTTEYYLTPTQPNIIVYVYPSVLKVNQQVHLKAWFQDDEGQIPTNTPLTYILSGDCGDHEWNVPTGTEITYTVTTPGSCEFKAVYTNSIFRVENKTSFTTEEPQITDHTLNVVKITNWDYNVFGDVYTDAQLNGTLQLYIDDVLVAEDTGFKSHWSVTYPIRNITPGIHEIKMVYEGDYGLSVEDSYQLIVPRHPYTIPYMDNYSIPFGVNITKYLSSFVGDKYKIAVTYVNKTHIEAIIYYPGNWYYEPAIKRITINILYPELNIIENNTNHTIIASVKNGYPGANVTIYCVKNGTSEIIYQTTLRGATLSVKLPDFDCDYVYMVYQNGMGILIVKDNEPEPILYISSCPAGISCVPVASSKFIKQVYIGGMSYTPGTPIKLEEGSYLVRVIETDGNEIRFTLTVIGLNGWIAVYYNPYDKSMIWIPSVEVPVKVVLSDGRILTVTGGDKWIHLPSPVVSVYSEWFKVKLLPLYILKG